MIIIEAKTEVSDFLDRWNNEPSIVIPVWVDLDKHPLNNTLSFLYIRISNFDYIINFNHIDAGCLEIDLKNSEQPKWCLDKKSLLQSNLGIKNTFDIGSYYFFYKNEKPKYNPTDEAFIQHYIRMGVSADLGKFTPLVKWAQFIKFFLDNLYLPITVSNWVDTTYLPVLSRIENFGIRIDPTVFSKRFPNYQKHIKGDVVYTQYNPYTITSRPSNRFAGINFSALNKSDGTREAFLPKDGHIFLQMDYDAYHPRIISKLINYTLPQTSVHRWFAEQYGTDYDEGKLITFKLLYGEIPDDFTQMPYYKGVKQFINELWEKSLKSGYIQTKHRRIILDFIENKNPQKVFNYLLQSLETEINIEKINNVLSFIENTGIELTLYTYDSFLFSYPANLDASYAKQLKEIIEKGGFPIKAKWGMTLNKL